MTKTILELRFLNYGPRDWPEDAEHENGNYYCECCHCGESFVGNKGRVSCRKCVDANAARWAKLTPAEREEETRKTAEAIRKFYEERDALKERHIKEKTK